MKSPRPIVVGIAVFLAVLALTQLIVFQRYLIASELDKEKALREATMVRDRLKSSLSYSLSATKTLAVILNRYGFQNDFDSVARDILKSHRYIDALELTRGGVITNVYPLEGNESVIGFDVLADTARNREAFKAIEKGDLYFAGPFELKQGGTAVVGRLPIYRDNAFWGFSVVIIKLETLLKAAGIDQGQGSFEYQLSKINPATGREEFFVKNDFKPTEKNTVSVDVPDGEWRVYVNPQRGSVGDFVPASLFGLLFSLTAGGFAWYSAKQPEKLNKLVRERTAQLGNLNRLYHFRTSINQMMVKVENEKSLFEEVCKIAVENGGFKMSWIGIIDEKQKALKAVATAGTDNGYLAEICPIDLSESGYGGPMVKIIDTADIVCCDDIATDPIMRPWAKKALDRGFQSVILLPVKKSGRILGCFNLYSGEKKMFEAEELLLLRGLVNDIEFSLENIERASLLKTAMQQIHHEKVLSDSIINSLPGVFYLYDQFGRFTRWNQNFEKVSGYTSQEISVKHPLDFFVDSEKPLVKEKIDEVFSKGYSEVKAEFESRDGKRSTYYFNGTRVVFDNIDYLIGTGIDITNQVQIENELYKRAKEIQQLTEYLQQVREEERTSISREIHDVLGQQLTGLKMDSSWLRKHFQSTPEAKDRINDMIELIDDTIKTVRRISMQLRPGILDDLGLIAALDWQASDFEKRTGIAVDFQSSLSEVSLPEKLATNVFRIFQEALTNVARHAKATVVKSKFEINDNYLQVEIIDNGIGIDPLGAEHANSLGIIGMKERARLFNGELKFERLESGGTVVRLIIPLNNNIPAYEISDIG